MNGRRPERRAGDLLVVTPMMKEMMLMEMKGPAAASETVVLKGVHDKPMPRMLICFVITTEDKVASFSFCCSYAN